jgi:predicted GNAT family acetyltransferase
MMTEGGPALTVTRNEQDEQFEARMEGGLGFLTYGLTDGTLSLLHTEVPPELDGHGVGSALVRGAMEYARAQKLRVVPFCPFARAWLKRHREYADLIEES